MKANVQGTVLCNLTNYFAIRVIITTICAKNGMIRVKMLKSLQVEISTK
jgi:hypothetical protein